MTEDEIQQLLAAETARMMAISAASDWRPPFPKFQSAAALLMALLKVAEVPAISPYFESVPLPRHRSKTARRNGRNND